MAQIVDKHSATSQFFINVADNAFFDYYQHDFDYILFDNVLKGIEMADKIIQVPINDDGSFLEVLVKLIIIFLSKFFTVSLCSTV